MEAEEKLTSETTIFETDDKFVIEQDKLLHELAMAIEKEQKEVDVLLVQVDDASKQNKEQELIHRELEQEYTSQKSKKDFIEENYDPYTNVRDLEQEIFAKVISTNLDVNQTVEEFKHKLKDTQQDVTKIIAQKRSMANQFL